MIKINSKYILDTDDLVFDVGAHNGDKTESYLKCGANVVCFEPQNECVANLKRRFLGNNHVHIEHKGLSDQEGKLQLSICTSDPYISTFSERWKTGRFISYNWDERIDVDVTTLDKAIAQFGKPRYVKIDVEGYEKNVISGLTQLLDFISFEFTNEFVDDAITCVEMLEDIGFNRFNFIFGEDDVLALDVWADSQLFKDLLNKISGPFWGDIYATTDKVLQGTRQDRSSENRLDFILENCLQGNQRQSQPASHAEKTTGHQGEAMTTSVIPYNQYEAQNAYQRLRVCLSRESSEAAIAEIKTFLKMFPDVPLAHNDLGVLYHQSGNDLLALAHYEKANRLQPNNPTVIKNLAEFYFVVLGWTDDAIEMLTELLNAWPNDFEILTALGNISEAVGRPDEARAFYRKANQLEPGNAEVREILARLDGPVSAAEYRQPALVQQEDQELEPLKRLLAQNPANALAHNNLGIVYSRRGEYEQARFHHEQAVQFEPSNLMYRKNLADLYYAACGMTDEAVEIYTQLIKEYPNDVEVLTALAILSKGAGLSEQARIFINKVLTLQPWNTEARTFLSGV